MKIIKNKKRTILYIAVIFCMIFIFYMSSQPAEQSEGISRGILSKLLGIIKPAFSDLTDQSQEELINAGDFYIRKAAHFSIYMTFGMFTAALVYTYSKRLRRVFGISFLVCGIYAVTDELHQLFVPERSGELRDVCIDCSGAVIGILLMLLFLLLRKRRKQRKTVD